MIDRARATAIAQEQLIPLTQEIGIELSLDLEATLETSDGWLVFWNSAAYLASNSIPDALAGNGPIAVDRETGAVARLPVEQEGIPFPA